MSITYEYSFIFTTVYFAILTMLTLFYLTKTRNIAIPYIVTLLIFTGAAYGTLDTDLTLYSRGRGVLAFPLLNIFLYLLFVFEFARYGLRYKRINEPVILNKSLLILATIIFIYSIYGVATGVSFANLVAPEGMINFINLYIFYLIMKWSIFDEKQLERFINVFIYAAYFMATYGIFRWALFGGDPANYYLNFGGQSSKITYFDIGQSTLFGVSFVILYHKSRLALARANVRWFYYLMMGLCLMNILLSFRRTAWLGMSYIFIWIFLTSSASRKILIAGIALVALAAGLSIYHERFDGSERSQDITSDITDKSGALDLKLGRFSEITRALMVTNQYSLTGLGPWAINSPRVTPEKASDFVHSSIIHVYIKTGIFGMLAYLSMFIGYVAWWIKMRNRRWRSNYYKALGDAFFCGFLLEIPDIIFGTPLIIFRHTQIMAMLFIMPYLCYRIDGFITEPKKIQQSNNKSLLPKTS